LIERTRGGRMATRKAYERLGIPYLREGSLEGDNLTLF